MQCVMNLTLQHFSIYLVHFVSVTVKQFTNFGILEHVIFIFESARMTVMFAPMLSVIFMNWIIDCCCGASGAAGAGAAAQTTRTLVCRRSWRPRAPP